LIQGGSDYLFSTHSRTKREESGEQLDVFGKGTMRSDSNWIGSTYNYTTLILTLVTLTPQLGIYI